MISDFFNNLSTKSQGHVIIGAGTVLLLNAMGISKALNFLVLIIGVLMMWYGLVLAGYAEKVQKLLSKKN